MTGAILMLHDAMPAISAGSYNCITLQHSLAAFTCSYGEDRLLITARPAFLGEGKGLCMLLRILSIHIRRLNVVFSCRTHIAKSMVTRKRRNQGGNGEETYKSQYEWGYTPSKRRRAAVAASSHAEPDLLADSHPAQTTSNLPLDSPVDAVHQASLQSLRHAGTQTPSIPNDHQHQPRGAGSFHSARPTSSGSEITTLYCSEQLADAVLDTADAVAPVTPPLSHQSATPDFMPIFKRTPGLFLPPISAKGANTQQHAAGLPTTEKATASLDMRQAASGAASGVDTPTSFQPATPSACMTVGAGTTPAEKLQASQACQASASPLEPRMTSQDAALACAETLLGAANHSPRASPQPHFRESLKAKLTHLHDQAMANDGEAVAQAKAEAISNFNASGPQCVFCLTRDTPQWRDGPDGPRTACNACSTAWQRARRPARPWLPGRVSRMLAAQAAAAAPV